MEINKISKYFAPAYHYACQIGIDVRPWAALAREPGLLGASIALVGNAGYLSTLQQGALIDEYDIVIRMNNFRISGYEKSVGIKTDIYINNFYSDIDFSNPHIDAARWIVSSVPNNFFKTESPKIVHRHARHITCGMKYLRRRHLYAPSMSEYREIFNCLGKSPTTGAMSLFLISRVLSPLSSRIFLTGFSFFEGKNHYFSESKADHISHAPEKEREVTYQLMRNDVEKGKILLDSVMRKYWY